MNSKQILVTLLAFVVVTGCLAQGNNNVYEALRKKVTAYGKGQWDRPKYTGVKADISVNVTGGNITPTQGTELKNLLLTFYADQLDAATTHFVGTSPTTNGLDAIVSAVPEIESRFAATATKVRQMATNFHAFFNVNEMVARSCHSKRFNRLDSSGYTNRLAALIRQAPLNTNHHLAVMKVAAEEKISAWSADEILFVQDSTRNFPSDNHYSGNTYYVGRKNELKH